MKLINAKVSALTEISQNLKHCANKKFSKVFSKSKSSRYESEMEQSKRKCVIV